MLVRVSQTAKYSCSRLLREALCQVRMTPTSLGQQVIWWELTIEGATPQVSFDDHHGNRVQLFSLAPDTTEVAIRCAGEVETEDRGGVIDRRAGLVPMSVYRRSTARTAADSSIVELCAGTDVVQAEGALATAHALSRAVHQEIGAESITSATGQLRVAHTHRFMAAALHMGLPARFVCGYLIGSEAVPVPPVSLPAETSGVDDASASVPAPESASHVWAEVWISGLGWVAFDVVFGACADDRYVRVACGSDHDEASPLSGIKTHNPTEATTVSVQSQTSQ